LLAGTYLTFAKYYSFVGWFQTASQDGPHNGFGPLTQRNIPEECRSYFLVRTTTVSFTDYKIAFSDIHPV
jgi:hypothetical protein